MGASRRRSCWGGVFIETPNAQEAVKSWFGKLAEGLIVTKAEILSDMETDEEKKLRIFCLDAEGHRFRLVRSRTVRGFNIVMRRLP